MNRTGQCPGRPSPGVLVFETSLHNYTEFLQQPFFLFYFSSPTWRWSFRKSMSLASALKGARTEVSIYAWHISFRLARCIAPIEMPALFQIKHCCRQEQGHGAHNTRPGKPQTSSVGDPCSRGSSTPIKKMSYSSVAVHRRNRPPYLLSLCPVRAKAPQRKQGPLALAEVIRCVLNIWYVG